MAIKRMFSLNVVDTDKFLEMPISSRLLYYELGMRADDDGFVDNWKKILLFTGLKEDDMKILISKQFILPFESGVIVIRHWRLNNYLQNDRTKPTIYLEEKQKLTLDENNVYNLYTECIHSIDKNSIDKNSIDKNSIDIEQKAELLEMNDKCTTNLSNIKDTVKDIVEYLNQVCGTNYKYTTAKTQTLIKARLNEHFTKEDFYKVINNKYNEWGADDKMFRYLRPETLFGTKFESYLNEKKKVTLKDIKIDYSDF